MKRIRKQCIICKKSIPSNRITKDTCSDRCGIEKSLQVAEQMRNKKGRFYDKWYKNLTNYHKARKIEEKIITKREKTRKTAVNNQTKNP